MTLAASGARPRPADLSWIDTAVFAFGVLMLFLYSQGWIMPLLGETVDPASAGITRDAYLPFYAVSLALLGSRPIEALNAMLRQPFLLALMFLVCVSTLWSIAPDQTARRAFALVCTTLCGVLLGIRWRWARLSEVVGYCFLAMAVLSFLASVAVPSVGRMAAGSEFPGAWRGLWLEKNALGGNMAMGFVCLASASMLNPRRRWLWSGGAVLCLLMVLASTSKTSLVALLLGSCALFAAWLVRRSPIWAVLAVWGSITVAGAAAAFAFMAPDVILGALGKDATLTGRTKIWSAAWMQIEKRPLTGFGYGVVWSDESGRGPLAWITAQAGFKPQHAHNTWLEQWLGMGLWGLIAFVLFYVQALVLAVIGLFTKPGAVVALSFMLVYSFISVTESIGTIYNDLRWVVLVAFAVRLAVPERFSEQPAAPRPRRL